VLLQFLVQCLSPVHLATALFHLKFQEPVRHRFLFREMLDMYVLKNIYKYASIKTYLNEHVVNIGPYSERARKVVYASLSTVELDNSEACYNRRLVNHAHIVLSAL